MSDERIAMVDANPYTDLSDFGPVSDELRNFIEEHNVWRYTGTIGDLINDMRMYIDIDTDDYDDMIDQGIIKQCRNYDRDFSKPNYRLYHRIRKAPGFSRELFEKYMMFQETLENLDEEYDDGSGPTSRYQFWEERKDYCEWNKRTPDKDKYGNGLRFGNDVNGKGWYNPVTT